MSSPNKEHKIDNPAWEFLYPNWFLAKALLRIGGDIVRNDLSDIGAPRIIIWGYVLSLFSYVVLFVWTVVVIIVQAVSHQPLITDYEELYLFVTVLAGLPFIIYALRRIGQKTWGKTSGSITGVMLLSVICCLAPPASLFSPTLPTYCNHYYEAPSTPPEPLQQLNNANSVCFGTSVKTLRAKDARTCATYVDVAAGNIVTNRPDVCQPGFIAPPRSDGPGML